MKPTWPPGVRAAVMARDLWVCVVCALPATQAHHRRPRGMGGTRATVTAAWGVAVCDGCHDRIESHRAQARDCGYLVHPGVPVQTALVWHGGDRHWRALTDDGFWVYAGAEHPPTAPTLLYSGQA